MELVGVRGAGPSGVEAFLCDARVLRTFGERLLGLNGTEEGEAVCLPRCRWVHSFGLKEPMDVAVVGVGGAVLVSARAVGGGCLIGHPQGCFVVERPASREPWVEPGQWVCLTKALAPRAQKEA